KELEKHTGVSSKYLEKVLKILLSTKTIASLRGANGGYILSKPSSDITLGAPIRALEEDNMEIIDCVAGKGCCCPSGKLWKTLFVGINDTLDKITLKDLVEGNL
ncbi:MAG: Rrf2 family transcriptional regulator, partial [Clostridia bacterium]|nr:Rrf2 family transcriptional regulator [Clostridia bacterium]